MLIIVGKSGHAWAIARHNDPHLLNTLCDITRDTSHDVALLSFLCMLFHTTDDIESNVLP